MLEVDLKAPASSANESFVAAASAAAGIGACRAVCVFAGAGQGKPGPQTQRRMQMIQHIRPRPTSEIFLVMNSTRLEPSRLGFHSTGLLAIEPTSIVVLVNRHRTRLATEQ